VINDPAFHNGRERTADKRDEKESIGSRKGKSLRSWKNGPSTYADIFKPRPSN